MHFIEISWLILLSRCMITDILITVIWITFEKSVLYIEAPISKIRCSFLKVIELIQNCCLAICFFISIIDITSMYKNCWTCNNVSLAFWPAYLCLLWPLTDAKASLIRFWYSVMLNSNRNLTPKIECYVNFHGDYTLFPYKILL